MMPSGANRLGTWAAGLLAATAALALVLAVTTPPRSGPFCTAACIGYPYTDAAAFVPRDYLWMYPACVMIVLFVVLLACIQATVAADRSVSGHVALALATIAASALLADYAIQLAVLQPSLVKGEAGALSLFSQYNPHGVFIALEEVGYLVMGVAFGFAAAAVGGADRLHWALRAVFTLGAALAIGSLVILALLFGLDLEYRYEVAVITIDWTTLIVVGGLLAVAFRRHGRSTN